MTPAESRLTRELMAAQRDVERARQTLLERAWAYREAYLTAKAEMHAARARLESLVTAATMLDAAPGVH